MSENEWTKMLGWPEDRVYRLRTGKKLRLCDCGYVASAGTANEGVPPVVEGPTKLLRSYEREVRDLPWSEYRTTVVIELYRVRCPECGIKAEKVALLPSKARFWQAISAPAAVLGCEWISGWCSGHVCIRGADRYDRPIGVPHADEIRVICEWSTASAE
jgi:hypothetical protein